MTPQTDRHAKLHKNWSIADDLYLLKNWNHEDNAIGEHLQRTNSAVISRRSLLRNTPNKIKEVKRSFPEAKIEMPGAEEMVKPRASSRPYTDQDDNYLVNNLDTNDNIVALKLDRTPGAISVRKSFLRKELLNGNQRLLDMQLETVPLYKSANNSRRIDRKKIRKAATRNTIEIQHSPEVVQNKSAAKAEKVFVLPFRDVQIDWNNKSLVFTIE